MDANEYFLSFDAVFNFTVAIYGSIYNENIEKIYGYI